jgi:hypothetical protein
MPVLLEAMLLVVAFFWFAITTVAGILFIPILLLIRVLLGESPARSTTRTTLPPYKVDLDHHVHVPLEKVPPEYYEAYKQYLKSPEWRALRKQVLKRDSYHCVDCSDCDIPLQVHHEHYDGIESMTFTTEQCVSVCHSCHAIRHGRDRV